MRNERFALLTTAAVLGVVLASCQKEGAPATTAGPTDEGATLGVEVSASVTSGTAPLAVTFTARPHGGKAPYSYSWTFGDGTGSSEPNPTRTFATGGAFRTVLTLTSGEERVTSSAIEVRVDSGVRLGCFIGPTQGIAAHGVSVRGNASGGSGSFTYRWTFGDGASATGAEASHEYAAPGTYTLTGTAQSGNVSASCSDTIRVYDRLVNHCKAWSPTGPAPLRVAFVAQANYCDETGCQFSWDFGDGSSATGRGLMRPEHDFNAPGLYDVVVQVQTDGKLDACTMRVEAQ